MKEELIKGFKERFNEEPDYLFDAGGRFEIIGNHTDHNHGLCLVANCSLRIYAAVKKDISEVGIKSKGYPYFSFRLEEVKKHRNFPPSTKALTYGIYKKFMELGYKIGGFKAYIVSEIPDGSGVSSSAAIESLIGYILSYLFNDGKVDPLLIAKIGQFSENNYFKKPCGLLDQIGTSFPNCNFIDFKDINKPVISTIDFNLPLQLYLIKSVGNHSNLTPLYAKIPQSMKEIAMNLENKQFLRDCNDKDIIDRIDNLNLDEDVKNIGKHFFIENENVLRAKKAIENNDLDLFLKTIKDSQNSSKNNLCNTFVKDDSYLDSPQDIIDKVQNYIGNNGAIRIHGGGFKGTVLAFIKNDFVTEFESFLNKNYKNRYYKVYISKNAINIEKLM